MHCNTKDRCYDIYYTHIDIYRGGGRTLFKGGKFVLVIFSKSRGGGGGAKLVLVLFFFLNKGGKLKVHLL